jgi:hypothetical protein
MAGVLQFTLGLEVHDFLHSCGLSSGAIIGMERVAEGLRSVMERTWGAIEQADALDNLSKRTGESAGNLFRLQESFKIAGVGGESVSVMLFQMQKALGGINDEGEDTSNIFSKLGLSIGDLKKMGGAEALSKIVGSLGRLDQSSAAKAASGIFGRMGAGNAVQLSRNAQDMAQAFEEAGKQAAIFDRISAAADKVGDTLLAVKRQVTGLFAGIAGGALPGIQSALDMLKGIDLTSIGQQIGAVIGAIGEAFASGEMTDLLKETFQAGWEFIGNCGLKVFNGLVAAIAERFSQFLSELPANFSAVFSVVAAMIKSQLGSVIADRMSEAGDVLKALGMDSLAQKAYGAAGTLSAGAAGSADQASEALKQQVAKSIAGAPGQMMDVMGAFKSGFEGTQDAFGTEGGTKLQAHLASLMARSKKLQGGSPEKGEEDSLEFGKGLSHKTAGTAFEKMGFVGSGASGPAHETAKNTAKSVDLLTSIRDKIYAERQAADDADWATNQPL